MDNNLSIAHNKLKAGQKIGLFLTGIALFVVVMAWSGYTFKSGSWVFITIGLMLTGIMTYAYFTYKDIPKGIKNNYVWKNSLTNRGVLGWLLGIVLTGFYIELYWFPNLLGLSATGENKGLIALFDPLSNFIKRQNASQWFVYGTLYTILIIGLGFKFLLKYRHIPYQRNRTIV